jgi:hypothetical protein
VSDLLREGIEIETRYIEREREKKIVSFLENMDEKSHHLSPPSFLNQHQLRLWELAKIE